VNAPWFRKPETLGARRGARMVTVLFRSHESASPNVTAGSMGWGLGQRLFKLAAYGHPIKRCVGLVSTLGPNAKNITEERATREKCSKIGEVSSTTFFLSFNRVGDGPPSCGGR